MIPLVNESKIKGLYIVKLTQIEDDRGAVLHMTRADLEYFKEIKEVYFSEVKAGVIKAWKRHSAITQNLTVPIGRIRLVVYDDRDDSSTKGMVEEIILGRPDRYYLVHIPPMLWYGFQDISESSSLIVNCTDLPHDPNEVIHLDSNDNIIPYIWQVNYN